MKKITIIISMFLITIASTYAQNSFKYQAVFRDTNDKPYTNTNIDLRFTILSGNPSGTIVYSENQTVVSSSIGIVSANIGEGTVLSGNFIGIDWSSNKYYLKVDADINGTGNYAFFGTNIISKVPMAVYADKCGDIDDADADPQNEIQSLSFDSNTNQLSISNGNSVTIPTGGTDADADPNNEIQTISKSGNTVSLSKNGGSFTDAVDDADNNSTNEIQLLSKSGKTISLSKNGGSFTDEVDDADNDPNNEIQTLSKTGKTIILSNNGGSFVDAVDDSDADSTNEIQQLHYDYMTNDFWIDGGQDTFHNSGSDIWSLYSTLVWPPEMNIKWGQANYPIFVDKLTTDTLRSSHINISDDIWFYNDFPGSPVLHLWNQNIHFDSIDGDFIIEPHSITSFSPSLNKGFYIDDNGLFFHEYFGAQFRPIDINRNYGIKMASPAGFKTVDINNTNGDIYLFNGNGSKKIELTNYFDRGSIKTYNSKGNPICYLAYAGTNLDHGYIAIGNEKGAIKAGMLVDDNDGGQFFILNQNGEEKAGMYIDNNNKGHLYADVKNFVMQDPEDDENMIMYASLEGPEAAAYGRGRGKLVEGKVFVPFENHFKKVVNTTDMTIQLTPMSVESRGLAVTQITKDGFWVQELYQGKGNYNFFWEAKGVRKGFEDYNINVPKSTFRMQKPLN